MVGANMIVGVDLNPAREALGRKFGMTHFVNPNDLGGSDLVRPPRRTDRRRRRLQLRMRRQHQADAPGAGMLPSRLGQIGDHRRRGRRPGDSDAAVPARHRPHWMGTAFGGAKGRRDVPKIVDWYMDGKIDIDLADHPHDAGREDQRRVRPDAQGRVDPQRRHVLVGRKPRHDRSQDRRSHHREESRRSARGGFPVPTACFPSSTSRPSMRQKHWMVPDACRGQAATALIGSVHTWIVKTAAAHHPDRHLPRQSTSSGTIPAGTSSTRRSSTVCSACGCRTRSRSTS